jgi:Ca2+/Na+ antiporter
MNTRRTTSRRREFLFRSSLCGMFQSNTTGSNKHRNNKHTSKTDACALAFGGIWLWERNRFLLTGEKPKRWMERPLETGIIVLLVATAVVWSLDPNHVSLSVSLVLVLCFFLWKIIEFQYTRKVFRQQLAIEEYRREVKRRNRDIVVNVNDDDDEGLLCEEEGKEGNDNNIVMTMDELITDPKTDPDLMNFLTEHQREVYGDGSHSLCGCASARFNPLNEGENPTDGNEDFCSKLWSFLANICCGWMCQCYCQLCGMCAIAQEHRYLVDILPADPFLWQRDYVTLQSWGEYYPAILRLRMSGQMNFLPHLKAMSTLSNRLVVTAMIFLVLVTLIILLPVHFPKWQILVVRFFFCQM